MTHVIAPEKSSKLNDLELFQWNKSLRGLWNIASKYEIRLTAREIAAATGELYFIFGNSLNSHQSLAFFSLLFYFWIKKGGKIEPYADFIQQWQANCTIQ